MVARNVRFSCCQLDVASKRVDYDQNELVALSRSWKGAHSVHVVSLPLTVRSQCKWSRFDAGLEHAQFLTNRALLDESRHMLPLKVPLLVDLDTSESFLCAPMSPLRVMVTRDDFVVFGWYPYTFNHARNRFRHHRLIDTGQNRDKEPIK